jgi:isopentenyldiphosphate isomerase
MLTEWEYEYRQGTFHDMDMILARSGRKGWELVSVTSAIESDEQVFTVFFKRPKQSTAVEANPNEVHDFHWAAKQMAAGLSVRRKVWSPELSMKFGETSRIDMSNGTNTTSAIISCPDYLETDWEVYEKSSS